MLGWLEGVGNFLKYTVSLPERTVRALAAGVGGVSKVFTDLALPEALRDTTTYRVLLGNMQRLVVERVGFVVHQVGRLVGLDVGIGVVVRVGVGQDLGLGGSLGGCLVGLVVEQGGGVDLAHWGLLGRRFDSAIDIGLIGHEPSLSSWMIISPKR